MRIRLRFVTAISVAFLRNKSGADRHGAQRKKNYSGNGPQAGILTGILIKLLSKPEKNR